MSSTIDGQDMQATRRGEERRGDERNKREEEREGKGKGRKTTLRSRLRSDTS
jgi:hypothetical protein